MYYCYKNDADKLRLPLSALNTVLDFIRRSLFVSCTWPVVRWPADIR